MTHRRYPTEGRRDAEHARVPQAISTYYDLAGGAAGLRRLAEAFYARLFADPSLIPLFQNPGGPEHAERLALFLAEALGGPREYMRSRGFSALFVAHHTRTITEEHRVRWVGHMLAACDDVAMPDTVRGAFAAYIEDASYLALNR